MIFFIWNTEKINSNIYLFFYNLFKKEEKKKQEEKF